MGVHSQQIIRNIVDIIIYNESENVTSNNITTILTYTASQDTKISKISCSGEDYAKFQIFVDTELIATKRSGPKRNVEWKFDSPLLLSNGSIIDIKVTHWHTGDTLNFETTLYAFE